MTQIKGILLLTMALSASSSMVASTTLADTAPLYQTLAQRRALITFPGYTPAQKQLVADQAQLLLRDVYVNRDQKITFYGQAVDPVPGVADVVANAQFMSEDALHFRLETLFTSQHDLHLSYRFPAPYACYRSLLPFSVAQAKDATGNMVVAVEALAADATIFDVVPEARRIVKGDVLVSYDHQNPLDAAKALINISGGANAFGSIRRALETLTYRSQRGHQLPENDVVRLAFRTRQGEDYAVELPWVSRAVDSCLNPPVEEPTAHGAAKNNGVDDYQIEFEKTYKPRLRISETESVTDTAEPILHYDVLHNEYGDFAYLRLDSFSPEVLTAMDTIYLVKHLLENELANTDGLILDLRDNGGGTIAFAEALVQLFTPVAIQPQGFRLKNSQVIRDLFAHNQALNSDFRMALDIAQTIGAPYTQALPLTGDVTANSIGQAYFKPMAVLNNSSCYSSCDLMSASLQDHGVAVIYGEDGATGGGGANNVQLEYFVTNTPAGQPGPFALLPAQSSMGVAWRQAVRVGKNAGKLIEEVGITPDKLAPPSIADFYSQDAVQMRTISANLAQQSAVRKSWFKLVHASRLDLPAGSPVIFNLQTSATEAIELRANGQTLGYQSVQAPSSSNGTAVQLTAPGTTSVGMIGNVELIGYRLGERVWRGFQPYRIVPTSTILADAERIALDFNTTDLSPLVVFTSGADASEGWSAQNGKLRVGTGVTYADGLTAEASIFLDLTSRTQPLTISFDMEGKTEADYDFFSASVKSNGSSTDIVAAVSGDIAAQHVTFDLTPFLGKKIEIRLTFASDEGVADTGVEIRNLIVE